MCVHKSSSSYFSTPVCFILRESVTNKIKHQNITMTKSVTCRSVPMGGAPKRNRTSIIRSNDAIHIEVTGSYWPRLVIEEHDSTITKKGSKGKKIKPSVLKVEMLNKKNQTKLLKFLQQNSMAPVAVPCAVFPSGSDTSFTDYRNMVSAATENNNTTTMTSPVLSSWETAPATPERPRMTGLIWPHLVENKPATRPYSPTSILRPRTVSH
jgi:hypothetical protein